MAFSSFSGVMEPFSKYPATPSWMSFWPFFSDRLLIANTGILAVDGVCFNVRSTSAPSIIGHEHVEKDYAGATTLSSKKPSFAVAGNENSITQAQQYSGICLRNKLTVINNQNHIVAQQGSPSSSPSASHSKTGPGTDRPEKVQGKWGRQTRGMVCGFISQNSSPLLALSVPIREKLPSQREENLLCLGIRS
jgi:hypothetical protein